MQQVLKKAYDDDSDAASVSELLVDLAGATYLRTTLAQPTFPDLWAMRSLG
jgi:hypothetical protein